MLRYVMWVAHAARLELTRQCQAILLPYGYSCTAKVSNLAAQQSLANGMKTVIAQAYGTSFEAGPICTTLYEVSVDAFQD
jgi:carboxypeptidase A4